MVTDPPYGVNYDPQWRNDHNIRSGVGANRATGKVANDDTADWSLAWALSPANVAYVWHGGRHAAAVQLSLESADCMARPIQNHDGNVYDPFLGSGTTMVAAHQLNRICYAMEIDPKYVQMAVDRMRKLDPSLTVKRNGAPWS
jgi:DNA modification methylase